MKEIFLMILLSVICIFGTSAYATDQVITAECTTKATGGDGRRNSCDSELQKITAPPGHVFAEKTLKGGFTSANGSEKNCNVGWESYVEVIPGTQIKQPRTITLRAHARSPKGHSSGRGWAKCRYTVKISKYQQ